MKYKYFYQFPIGEIGIAEEDGAISHVFFQNTTNKPVGAEIKETPLIKRAMTQISEYFDGRRTEFDLPLTYNGTQFQVAAWEALCKIPYGGLRSYKEQAISVGSPKACRAIGLANNRNPISIIIPCHRVVGHNGKLVGYGGGLSIKEFLIDLEKRQIEI